MIARIAILFTGLVVGCALTPIYTMAFTFVLMFLLGSPVPALDTPVQVISLVAGFVTSFCLLRRSWTTPPLKKYVPRKNVPSSGESESQPPEAP